MIFGMGPIELLLIVVVVLVIFGPKNLPKIGSALGKTVKNVREGMEEGSEDKSDEAGSPIESHDDVEVIEDDDDADAPEAAASDAVFCSQCGTKNAAGAAFCSKCGNKLN